MSNQEFKYCQKEMQATIKMGRKIIDSVQESIDALNNPSARSPRDVYNKWMFITATFKALGYNRDIIRLGAMLGMAEAIPGYLRDSDRDTEIELTDLPIHED